MHPQHINTSKPSNGSGATTITARSPQPNSQQPISLSLLDFAVNSHKSNLIVIKFNIKFAGGTKDKEVSFGFDINKDTSYGVAEEMVNELGLTSDYVQFISSQIEKIKLSLSGSPSHQHSAPMLHQSSGHNHHGN